MSAFVKFVAFAGLSLMVKGTAEFEPCGEGTFGVCAKNAGGACSDVCGALGTPYFSNNQCNNVGEGAANTACDGNLQCFTCAPGGGSGGDTCADFDGSVCADELKLPDSTPGNTAFECCVCPPCESGCDPTFECVASERRRRLELELSKSNLRA